MWYVYVLKSLRNGRHCTGSTDDLQRRFLEHNKGKTPSTQYNGPYKIVYQEEVDTRLAAPRRERFLKSGQGREYLKQIEGG